MLRVKSSAREGRASPGLKGSVAAAAVSAAAVVVAAAAGAAAVSASEEDDDQDQDPETVIVAAVAEHNAIPFSALKDETRTVRRAEDGRSLADGAVHTPLAISYAAARGAVTPLRLQEEPHVRRKR